MVGFYLLLLTFVALVAFAGYDETMKIFTYLDLQIRYAFVKMQMRFMAWNLKRQLVKETTNFSNFIEEYKNDQ